MEAIAFKNAKEEIIHSSSNTVLVDNSVSPRTLLLPTPRGIFNTLAEDTAGTDRSTAIREGGEKRASTLAATGSNIQGRSSTLVFENREDNNSIPKLRLHRQSLRVSLKTRKRISEGNKAITRIARQSHAFIFHGPLSQVTDEAVWTRRLGFQRVRHLN